MNKVWLDELYLFLPHYALPFKDEHEKSYRIFGLARLMIEK